MMSDKDSENLTIFIDTIMPTVLDAGEFALGRQGHVQNIGKDV